MCRCFFLAGSFESAAVVMAGNDDPGILSVNWFQKYIGIRLLEDFVHQRLLLPCEEFQAIYCFLFLVT